jgi:hypothetical protein
VILLLTRFWFMKQFSRAKKLCRFMKVACLRDSPRYGGE